MFDAKDHWFMSCARINSKIEKLGFGIKKGTPAAYICISLGAMGRVDRWMKRVCGNVKRGTPFLALYNGIARKRVSASPKLH